MLKKGTMMRKVLNAIIIGLAAILVYIYVPQVKTLVDKLTAKFKK